MWFIFFLSLSLKHLNKCCFYVLYFRLRDTSSCRWFVKLHSVLIPEWVFAVFNHVVKSIGLDLLFNSVKISCMIFSSCRIKNFITWLTCFILSFVRVSVKCVFYTDPDKGRKQKCVDPSLKLFVILEVLLCSDLCILAAGGALYLLLPVNCFVVLHVQVRVAALQNLVKIMSLYYQYMETYMGPALFAVRGQHVSNCGWFHTTGLKFCLCLIGFIFCPF